MYGLVAETVDVSEDTNVYTFHLREGARFHDGTPLTAEDVAFSLALLKEKGHPNLAEMLRPMAKAEASDASTAVVSLDGTQNRETILSIAGMPIFAKAYYSARPFDSSTLEPPLGSGPYKVGNLAAGRFIEYERVADYWGKDLPVNVGYSNFDVIRIDFFQERQTAFEAFKKGDITFREEFTSITWAQDYNFPAASEGKVKKALFPTELRPSLQAFFFNTRRKKFSDPRTRLAIALAFDFEWSNRNLFFDAYTREFSYFQKSDFMAEGMPSGEEVALLEPYRADLPPEVFGEPYVPPKTDGSGRDRSMLKRASDLMVEAGWRQLANQVVDEEGAPLTVEFLIDAQVFERVLSPYVENLKAIGIAATVRQVDPSQYAQRLNTFDFDVILVAWSFGATPLDGFQQLFGSAAADTAGSDNYAGIKSKAVDGLIDKLKEVETREQLVTLLRALDRVLRAGQYWVPSWYSANHRVAHWDLFGWPEKKPDYAFTPETTWWFDPDKARAIGYTG
jgi:microcin C transport system substrate-binding protein